MRFEPSRLAFVWIALQGGPMGRAAVYQRVCIATEQELGVRINPHAFRAIVATGSPCRRM